MIKFNCPSCGKRYSAAAEKAGKRARCGRCGTRMTVPRGRRGPWLLAAASAVVVVGLAAGLMLWPKGASVLEKPNEAVSEEARERLAFDEARRADTVEAYRRYLTRHPKGADAAQVEAILREEAAFEQAMRMTDREEGLAGYLREFPDGRHAEGLQERIEGLRYKAAVSGGMTELRGFLEAYPHSRHRVEVEAALDVAAFEDASRAGTVQALEVYLRDYPEGARRAEAEERLDDARFAIAVQAGLDGLLDYLRQHPQGRHRDKAAELRDRAAYGKAVEAGTIGSLRAYVSNFPSGAHATEAGRRIEELEEAESYENAVRSALVEAQEAYLVAYPEGRHAAEIRRRLQNPMDVLSHVISWPAKLHYRFGDDVTTYTPKNRARFLVVRARIMPILYESVPERDLTGDKKAPRTPVEAFRLSVRRLGLRLESGLTLVPNFVEIDEGRWATTGPEANPGVKSTWHDKSGRLIGHIDARAEVATFSRSHHQDGFSIGVAFVVPEYVSDSELESIVVGDEYRKPLR